MRCGADGRLRVGRRSSSRCGRTNISRSNVGDAVEHDRHERDLELPATAPPAMPVIVERRAMTPDEHARIDGERPLECEHAGGANWDYDGSPIEDDIGGETSEEALLAVIADLDTDGSVRRGRLPESGWIELVDDGSATFVHDATEWRILVRFATYEPGGVYRRQWATLCPPDGYVPPTDPATLPPVTLPPYVETTVDLSFGHCHCLAVTRLPGRWCRRWGAMSPVAAARRWRRCSPVCSGWTGSACTW